MAQRKDILVYDVPDDVREALIADAEAQNISINDCALKILMAEYKLTWKPSGMGFNGGEGRNLAIRGGASLHRKIDIERARRGGGTLRGIVLEKLAIHYGIDPEPIGRRPSVSST